MMKMLMMVAIATGSLMFANTAMAQTPPPAKDERGSDKLDLKKLEDKYWSAKDSDFSVVQNRTYAKANKMFVSLGYGPLINDAYSYGRMTNVAAGYYLSERWGFEVAYETGALKNNDSTDAFINKNKFAPDYNQFKTYTSLNAIVVPFYAKMSFWDRKIMYFDMQFAFGVGQMQYKIMKADGVVAGTSEGTDSSEDANTIGYNLDVTQQLFFHENFAVRLDIKNKWTTQEKKRYYQAPGQDRELGKSSQQDTSILLGLTVFF